MLNLKLWGKSATVLRDLGQLTRIGDNRFVPIFNAGEWIVSRRFSIQQTLLCAGTMIASVFLSGCAVFIQGTYLNDIWKETEVKFMRQSPRMGKRVGIVVYGRRNTALDYYPGVSTRHRIAPERSRSGIYLFYVLTLGWVLPAPRSIRDQSIVFEEYNPHQLLGHPGFVFTPAKTSPAVAEVFADFFKRKGHAVEILDPFPGKIKDLLAPKRGQMDAICVIRYIVCDYDRGFPKPDKLNQIPVKIGVKATVFSVENQETILRFKSHGTGYFQEIERSGLAVAGPGIPTNPSVFNSYFEADLRKAEKEALRELCNKLEAAWPFVPH